MISALRTSALRARSAAGSAQLTRGGFNPSNDGYGHLPFKISNKVGFAIKLTLYTGIGFAAPFLHAYFQLKKGGTI
ncbi:hypothetical protein BCR44DRAFT_1431177 [Catenaria anguillulae PL171]|uniref:Cytochrome c oxidase subunit 8, mitochondrial n=1 Tax=Catenaria anguillulae PL171 TaxID=765915 RepID=A0A1Y2HQS8_9FUNG|nr:hypothetical protein BCR44DRAFT_1431177 [Catenaria anguillulae PL171]